MKTRIIISAILACVFATLILAVGTFYGMNYSERNADERAELRIQKKLHVAAMVNRPVLIGSGKFTVQIFQEQIAGAGDEGYRRSWSNR